MEAPSYERHAGRLLSVYRSALRRLLPADRLTTQLTRYAFAIELSLLATALTIGLKIAIGAETLLIFLLAVIAAAWVTDVRSSVLAVAITAAAVVSMLFKPAPSLGFDGSANVTNTVLYVLVAPVVAYLTYRVAVDRRERSEDMAMIGSLNKELRRALDVKDEFFGLISHELRTPITTIVGNAEVLLGRAGQLSETARQTALADIGAESLRLASVVDNLLILAKLDRGQTLPVEPLILEHIVERVAEQHSRRFAGRIVKVTTEPGSSPVMAAPGYVDQVIRNLLTNAEQYSPEDEPIDALVAQDGPSVFVSVLDRGPGIPEGDARIFRPLYRSPRTAHLASGLGLGLAVCQRLIEAQGGAVWARPREGGGSNVGFSLPVVRLEPFGC